MPRVAPITGKSDVPAEYHEVVDGVLEVFGQIRGPFSMLLHSPEVADRMLSFVRFFRTDCIVEPKDRVCHPDRGAGARRCSQPVAPPAGRVFARKPLM